MRQKGRIWYPPTFNAAGASEVHETYVPIRPKEVQQVAPSVVAKSNLTSILTNEQVPKKKPDCTLKPKSPAVDRTASPPFRCSHCDECFSTRTQLKFHEKIHLKKMHNFKCEICKQDFDRKWKIKQHYEQIHEGFFPYGCAFCPLKFYTLSLCSQHERSHTQKLYGCEFCTEKFYKLSDQLEHERIHTQEKPYMCQICRKDFGHAVTLKEHMQIHSNVYHCELCNQKCIGLLDLRIHNRLNHETPHTGEYFYVYCQLPPERGDTDDICILNKNTVSAFQISYKLLSFTLKDS